MTAVSNILKQIHRRLARVTASNQGFERSRPAVRSGVPARSWKKLKPLMGVSLPVRAG